MTGILLLANSLFDGFVSSNMIGRGIVVLQLVGSLVMIATIIGKSKELTFIQMLTRRFLRDFSSYTGVLDYYTQRRPQNLSGIGNIYKATCERVLKLLSPDARIVVAGRERGTRPMVLSTHEIQLVRGTCEHMLDDEEIRIEKGMGLLATIVALEPMLGLLGTVWGVLDAFAEMGTAGSASLAAIAPSISSALVTTVVGLIIAIPGVIASNQMGLTIRKISSDMEGFADELIGRVAFEFQGKEA